MTRRTLGAVIAIIPVVGMITVIALLVGHDWTPHDRRYGTLTQLFSIVVLVTMTAGPPVVFVGAALGAVVCAGIMAYGHPVGSRVRQSRLG